MTLIGRSTIFHDVNGESFRGGQKWSRALDKESDKGTFAMEKES